MDFAWLSNTPFPSFFWPRIWWRHFKLANPAKSVNFLIFDGVQREIWSPDFTNLLTPHAQRHGHQTALRHFKFGAVSCCATSMARRSLQMGPQNQRQNVDKATRPKVNKSQQEPTISNNQDPTGFVNETGGSSQPIWHLQHDPEDSKHLCGILWVFCTDTGIMANIFDWYWLTIRSWIMPDQSNDSGYCKSQTLSQMQISVKASLAFEEAALELRQATRQSYGSSWRIWPNVHDMHCHKPAKCKLPSTKVFCVLRFSSKSISNKKAYNSTMYKPLPHLPRKTSAWTHGCHIAFDHKPCQVIDLFEIGIPGLDTASQWRLHQMWSKAQCWRDVRIIWR